MLAFALRRLLALPLLLLAVFTLVFLALRVLPGSAVDTLSSQLTSAHLREQLVRELGLDRSLPEQYAITLGQILQGDFGRSFLTGREVGRMLATALPPTIELAVASLLVMVAFGLLTGLVAAAAEGSALDWGLRGLAMVLFSVPWFWFGLLLVIVFSLWLGWLPPNGRLPAGIDYAPVTNFVLLDAALTGRWDLVGPWLRHLTLPALTVGLTTAGMLTRIARDATIATARLDFVRTARMKGAGGLRVFLRHVLRNASLGILTIVGVQFGAMLGGSVVAEVTFGYPGIGKMLVDAVTGRDYAAAQGAALAIATLYILVNLATDLAYRAADPRLRRA
ncbi:ABC transporter permease [Rubellimicrobium sp. CFH 75288]|uniref:ABC transporter permease n=1 Tax=Rubellimicrobium sp. CFH 75288 TaxID=2697034 RepID=UPI001411C0FD|nr:ABC transporter permease [Rubellimicrobium sp. CFH 75288]NAZ37362.1 ABC transporter permease subunit [Rubellimicrobium sp. CFH 75288]